MVTEGVHSIHLTRGCFDICYTTFHGPRAGWDQVLRVIQKTLSSPSVRHVCFVCFNRAIYTYPFHIALISLYFYRRALRLAGRSHEMKSAAPLLEGYAPNLFDISEDSVGTDSICRDANVTQLINLRLRQAVSEFH